MKLWLTGVVLLCACGVEQSPPPPFYSPCEPVLLLPEGASSEELSSIDGAIALWKGVGLDTFTTTAMDSASQVPVRFTDAPWNFHGVYEAGVVFINHQLEGSERDITVAHELGHTLGLLHVSKEERISVMNPGNLTVPPTPADLDDLRRQWGCPSP